MKHAYGTLTRDVARQPIEVPPAAAGIAPAPPAPSSLRPARSRKRLVPIWVHVSLSVVWLGVAAAGSPYYGLEAAERLRHPWHPLLKPNGALGLAYGYAGTFLLFLLLAYSVRKRARWLAHLGALRKWLAVHITCGLLGPAFITLHAGFKVQGAIAIGYWAMICVMLSGFVGYYLYSQLPRAIAGESATSNLLRDELESLDRELVERFGLGAADIAELRRISGADRADRLGPLASLAFLGMQDLGFALRLRRLRHTGLARRGRRELQQVRRLVRRRLLTERRLAFLRQTEALFGYWHTVHKPFAIAMYTMLTLHIAVAIWLGYAWAW
jgi:hypothetical protein